MGTRAYLPNTSTPGRIIPGFTPVQAPPSPTPAAAQPIVSSPPVSPPEQFTNVGSLIDTLGIVKLMVFLRRPSTGGNLAALPNTGLPGHVMPGFNLPYQQHGQMLVEGLDYTRVGGLITLLTVVPGPKDILTAIVFSRGRQLGGSTPTRYVAPWQLPLPMAGPYDAVGTVYSAVVGPTIFGLLDGKNSVFTTGAQFPRWSVYRNGILQTIMADVVTGPNVFRFLKGAVPVPGDIISAMGWPS